MHFRYILFYEYIKGNNAASAFKIICATYGEGSLSERICRKWFTRLREGNFNLSDESRPGQSSDCHGEAIRGPLSKMHIKVLRKILKSTVRHNLKKMGMVNRYNVWYRIY